MTVTAPAGFEAAGVAAGLKSTGKPDVAVVVNRGPLTVGAAVFTSNRAKANPILWSEQAIQDGVVEAIVLNSGGANCFTGSFGFLTTHLPATSRSVPPASSEPAIRSSATRSSREPKPRSVPCRRMAARMLPERS